MERRGDDRGAVQSGGQGRPRHARARRAEEQLGQHDRHAAVRGLCRDLRPHLHLRRPEDHQPRARSRAPTASTIPGLFAAGELVGGLFYHNYPGGTGLVSGAVLGKLAGDGAGKYVSGQELASGPRHRARMPIARRSNDHHPPPRPRPRLERPPPAVGVARAGGLADRPGDLRRRLCRGRQHGHQCPRAGATS